MKVTKAARKIEAPKLDTAQFSFEELAVLCSTLVACTNNSEEDELAQFFSGMAQQAEKDLYQRNANSPAQALTKLAWLVRYDVADEYTYGESAIADAIKFLPMKYA